jgi:hypothetical protein
MTASVGGCGVGLWVWVVIGVVGLGCDWGCVGLVGAEALDGGEGGGAEGWVRARRESDEAQGEERGDDGEGGDDGVREDVGQGEKAHGEDDAEAEEEAEGAGDEGDDGGLGEELAADVGGGGAEGFADADLTGALGDGDEHDVHDTDAAEGEGEEGDGGEEDGHGAEDVGEELGAFEGVPDPEGVEVGGVELVAVGEDLADLEEGLFVEGGGDGLGDDVVDGAAGVGDLAGVGGFDGGLVEGGGKVALHGGKGDEELGVVSAGAVAAVLFFAGEDADDGVGVAGDLEGLADGGLAGEELAVGVGAEDDDAVGVGFVVGGEETALVDGEGAEGLVLGPDAADGVAGGVVGADLGDGAADFRGDGFDERSEALDGEGVVEGEEDVAAGGVTAEGHGGFAAEADGDVGAEGLHAVLLVDAEADAETDEEDDGGDAPDDAEHGEEAAELGVPEGGDGLFEDFGERHVGSRRLWLGVIRGDGGGGSLGVKAVAGRRKGVSALRCTTAFGRAVLCSAAGMRPEAEASGYLFLRWEGRGQGRRPRGVVVEKGRSVWVGCRPSGSFGCASG